MQRKRKEKKEGRREEGAHVATEDVRFRRSTGGGLLAKNKEKKRREQAVGAAKNRCGSFVFARLLLTEAKPMRIKALVFVLARGAECVQPECPACR